MKNIFLITLAACSAMWMMSSCTSENIVSESNDTPIIGSRLTLKGILNSESRVTIGEKDGNAYPLLWSEGDALGVFSTTQGAEIKNVQSFLDKKAVGKNVGIFTSDDVKMAPEGTTDLVVYYPYRANVTLSEDGNQLTSSLSTEQNQARPNDSGHIGKYGFSYAKTSVPDPESLAQFTLKHTMAYVKFTISSQELSTYKLTSISLYDKDAKTSLSGSFTVDMENGTLVLAKDVKPYATVYVEEPEVLSSAQDIYLTVLPAQVTGKPVYVVVNLANDKQTVTIPICMEAKELKAGSLSLIQIKDLKLSDNSCSWFEPIETRLLAGNGWAYGEANCLLTNISTDGVSNIFNVKARGNFMEVEEPKYAKVTLSCDLNPAHKMLEVNGSKTDMAAIASDCNLTVNAYKVNGGYDGACGLISIYGDDQQTVLWNFIVWMTPTPQEQVYGNTGYVVLDRNLGAFMTGEGDNWKANGVYFQWGRPIPIGWSAKANGSPIATEATSVRFSIEHPTVQLCTNNVENTKSDWYLGAWTGARTDRNDAFWGNPNDGNTYLNPSDGHKSIYDPSPKGYRVVSPKVLDEIQQKGTFVKQKGIAVIKYCYDGTNYAYWPLAGCKWGSNGGNSGNNTGMNAKGMACYWSNSSASSYGNDKDQGASCMQYKVDGTWTHSAGRSHAFSVRCMRDTENR